MATTSPDNIRTPNPSDPYNLVADAAITASDVQTALNRRANSYIGTQTEMAAFTSAPTGTSWFNTTDNQQYRRISGTWSRVTPGLFSSGNISSLASLDVTGLTGFNRFEVTLITPTSSTDNDLNVQLLNGTTPDTSANYDRQTLVGANATAAASRLSGVTSWQSVVGGARPQKTVRLTLLNMGAAEPTFGEISTTCWDAVPNSQVINIALRHRTATAFNGVRFVTSTGTISGRYEVRAS